MQQKEAMDSIAEQYGLADMVIVTLFTRVVVKGAKALVREERNVLQCGNYY
jgi:hypothetical protein